MTLLDNNADLKENIKEFSDFQLLELHNMQNNSMGLLQNDFKIQ